MALPEETCIMHAWHKPQMDMLGTVFTYHLKGDTAIRSGFRMATSRATVTLLQLRQHHFDSQQYAT